MSLSLVSTNPSERLIKSCNSEGCTIYPNEQAELYGFYGTDEDWNQLFQHCADYEYLNELTLYTELLASVAVSIIPAGVMAKSPRVIKMGTSTLGRLTSSPKIIKGGTNFALQSAVALPLTAMSDASPYPEIPAEYVYNSMRIINSLLDENSGKLFFKPDSIMAIDQLIHFCTAKFVEERVNKLSQQCLGSCHSGNSTDTMPKNEQPQKDFKPVARPQKQDSLATIEIQNYLVLKILEGSISP